MARVEKTVFISYRRVDGAWALGIFNWLIQHGYDVFIDYEGIGPGAFETVILDNILSRAHFLLILSPKALERCNEPGDWFRREIETALASGRNIVPLMVDGFTFRAPPVVAALSGALELLPAYNGLDISVSTFPRAMNRLAKVFLRVPLNAVLHPPGAQAIQAANEQKLAANGAARQTHPRASALSRARIEFAYFFERWFRVGLGVSTGILILALSLTQYRSAPFVVEREFVGALLAAASGSCMLWVLAGKIAKGGRGLLLGLFACFVTTYILLRQVDLYPVSDVSQRFALRNPNDQWSYGYMPSTSSEFKLFDEQQYDNEVERFNVPRPGFASIPEVLHNKKPYTVKIGAVHLIPRVVELHPGWYGERAVVRWTARRSSVYRISGYFVGLNEAPTTTDVHVLFGQKTSLFKFEVESFGVPTSFNIVQKVDAGDVIDFVVGYGTKKNSNPTSDSTGLVAWIELVE